MLHETWEEPVNITKEQWINLLRDEEVIKEEDVEVLKLIYTSIDSSATASQLARLLNMPHFAPLNSQVGRLGKRIVNKIKIEAPKEKYGDGYNWWNVPFLGKSTKEGFYWILRLELKEAMKDLYKVSLEDDFTFPDEVDIDNPEEWYEGVKKQVYVNQYERDRRARDKCIKIHGTRCSICGFDFEKVYGKAGKNVIHVHHLKPLSEIGREYKIDPKNDLRPVCPNCHTMIHRKKLAYSIDEVKAMIKNAAS
jgi:5-methylcytosine-specific restriction protein A